MSKPNGLFCEICEKPLVRQQRRFCSNKCHGRWQAIVKRGVRNPAWKGDKVNATCVVCETVFPVLPYRIKQGKAKTCSPDCLSILRSQRTGKKSGGWKGGKVKCVCKNCGVSFAVHPSRIDDGRGKFCGVPCHMSWMNKRKEQGGDKNHNWQGGPVECTCSICNTSFPVSQSRFARGKAQFCSPGCQAVGMSGENAPNWQGGISFDPYDTNWTETRKVEIRERDNYTCALCGAPDSKDVHHIDYCKTNSLDDDNLITLCRSCHSKTQKGREHWQAALTEIMQQRHGGDTTGNIFTSTVDGPGDLENRPSPQSTSRVD